jgi:hypothetical protein
LRIESNFENHDQVEDSAPSQPTPPSDSDERTTEEVADAPPVEGASPQPPSLADQVGDLLANDGYAIGDLLALLREVKLIGPSVELLEQCPPKALTTVIDDWANCKRRLDTKKVPA